MRSALLRQPAAEVPATPAAPAYEQRTPPRCRARARAWALRQASPSVAQPSLPPPPPPLPQTWLRDYRNTRDLPPYERHPAARRRRGSTFLRRGSTREW